MLIKLTDAVQSIFHIPRGIAWGGVGGVTPPSFSEVVGENAKLVGNGKSHDSGR